MSESLTLEPSEVATREGTLMPMIEHQGAEYLLTVVIQRPGDAEQLPAEAIDAWLLTDTGEPMNVVERPAGRLPQAGGALGLSANAWFRFSGGGRAARLEILLQGVHSTFHVVAD